MKRYNKIIGFIVFMVFTMMALVPFELFANSDSTVTSTLTIYKTDDKNNKLPKAAFLLKSNDGNYSRTSFSDAEDGKIVFDSLIPGSYTLTEKKAPQGFSKITTPWDVVVKDNGKIFINNHLADSDEKNLGVERGDWPGKNQDKAIETYDSLNNDKARNPNPYDKDIDEGGLSKRISKLIDDAKNKYEIELTVRGKTNYKQTPREPLDVVIVLDNSNSMNNGEPFAGSNKAGNYNKAKKAKKATEELIDTIIGASPENRVATVVYASEILDGGIKHTKKGYDSRYYPTKLYSGTVPNFSSLTLTNSADAIREMKSRLPDDAALARGLKEGDKDFLRSQFGATFTMQALMKAEDILNNANRPESKKVIIHITDGVPTRSYMPKFNHSITAKSYANQFSEMKKLSKDDFVIEGTNDKPDLIKGNGESWFIYPKGAAIYKTFNNSKDYNKVPHLGLNTQYFPDAKGANPIYPLENHGQATKLYTNYLKERYEIFSLGISFHDLAHSVNKPPHWNSKLSSYEGGGEITHKISKAETLAFLESISTDKNHFAAVDETNDAEGLIAKALMKEFGPLISKENSIIDGIVEDPMGDGIEIDLGDNNAFDFHDYTLVASDGSKFENGQAPKTGLLSTATISFEPSTKTIRITGLNLGEKESIKLTYAISLKDSFENSTFYRTNKRTTLAPKSKNPTDLRDFPIPAIRDVRVYQLKVTNKVSNLGRFEILKTDDSSEHHPLPKARFTLTKLDDNGKKTGLYFTQETENDGSIVFENLSKGKYILEETRAPKNYQKSNKTWQIIVSDKGEVYASQQDDSGNNVKKIAISDDKMLNIASQIVAVNPDDKTFIYRIYVNDWALSGNKVMFNQAFHEPRLNVSLPEGVSVDSTTLSQIPEFYVNSENLPVDDMSKYKLLTNKFTNNLTVTQKPGNLAINFGLTGTVNGFPYYPLKYGSAAVVDIKGHYTNSLKFDSTFSYTPKLGESPVGVTSTAIYNTVLLTDPLNIENSPLPPLEYPKTGGWGDGLFTLFGAFLMLLSIYLMKKYNLDRSDA